MDEIRSLNDSLTRIFENISGSKLESANSIVGLWKSTLLKINSDRNPNEGRNLVDHSRVIDLKNGVLLVEADHPGWIELLQLRKKFILTCINNSRSGIKVSSLAFRLRGNGGELADTFANKQSPEKIREELEKNMDAEEKVLNSELERLNCPSSPSVQKNNSALPPELEVIFKDLKESMLTNSKE